MMEVIPASTEADQNPNRPAHWWKPGQSGNPAGRPKGSRQKIANEFIDTYLEVYKLHGRAGLEKIAIENPLEFHKLGLELLPKDVNLNIEQRGFVVRAPMVAATSEAWAQEAGSGPLIEAESVSKSMIQAHNSANVTLPRQEEVEKDQ